MLLLLQVLQQKPKFFKTALKMFISFSHVSLNNVAPLFLKGIRDPGIYYLITLLLLIYRFYLLAYNGCSSFIHHGHTPSGKKEDKGKNLFFLFK